MCCSKFPWIWKKIRDFRKKEEFCEILLFVVNCKFCDFSRKMANSAILYIPRQTFATIQYTITFFFAIGIIMHPVAMNSGKSDFSYPWLLWDHFGWYLLMGWQQRLKLTDSTIHFYFRCRRLSKRVQTKDWNHHGHGWRIFWYW